MKIGAHVSTAGWIDKAIQRAYDIWANSLQIFTHSPRMRKLPNIWQEIFEQNNSERKKYSVQGWIIHSSYLANLAKNFEDAKPDIDWIIFDMNIWSKTGYDYVNVHIGKHAWKIDIFEAKKNMAKNVEYILKNSAENICFVFENTAGQWSEMWRNFDELWDLFKNYFLHLPIWICLDTAHLWWGWNDVRNWENLMSNFDEKVWLKYLKCIHLNDSKATLGSKLDRHASLGKWFIWIEAISKVAKFCEKNDILTCIETPEPEIRAQEISMLKKIIKDDFDLEQFHNQNYKTQFLKKFENDDSFF